MKILSVLLIACMVVLPSFSGMVKPALGAAAKMSCCKNKEVKHACHKQSTPGKKGACSMPGCTMFTCNMYGFVAITPVVIKPAYYHTITKPNAPYKIGDVSSFQSLNRKPPKAC